MNAAQGESQTTDQWDRSDQDQIQSVQTGCKILFYLQAELHRAKRRSWDTWDAKGSWQQKQQLLADAFDDFLSSRLHMSGDTDTDGLAR